MGMQLRTSQRMHPKQYFALFSKPSFPNRPCHLSSTSPSWRITIIVVVIMIIIIKMINNKNDDDDDNNNFLPKVFGNTGYIDQDMWQTQRCIALWTL